MKHYFLVAATALLVLSGLSSCSKDTPDVPPTPPAKSEAGFVHSVNIGENICKIWNIIQYCFLQE